MRNTVRIILGLVALVFGFLTTYLIMSTKFLDTVAPNLMVGSVRYLVMAGGSLLFGLIYIIFFRFLIRHGSALIQTIAETITKKSPAQIIGGTVGLLIGIVIAFFISQLYNFIQINLISTLLGVITYIFFGYLGSSIGFRFMEDVQQGFPELARRFQAKSKGHPVHGAMPKVLDTSAIIDGRIVDISRTGFLEGELVVTEFVLKELRHIADSSDDLTRVKGRRGLDFIKELQEIPGVTLTITSKDFPETGEVDIKLLKLATELKGAVITNDYNLNKVASLQNIKVLNVNDLSNAVKPNAIPGETFMIEIIKRGKEAEQGVGYLSDGTMIVVDKAKNRIGEDLLVEVTSVLQTPAGRMIFAKIKE